MFFPPDRNFSAQFAHGFDVHRSHAGQSPLINPRRDPLQIAVAGFILISKPAHVFRALHDFMVTVMLAPDEIRHSYQPCGLHRGQTGGAGTLQFVGML